MSLNQKSEEDIVQLSIQNGKLQVHQPRFVSTDEELLNTPTDRTAPSLHLSIHPTYSSSTYNRQSQLIFQITIIERGARVVLSLLADEPPSWFLQIPKMTATLVHA